MIDDAGRSAARTGGLFAFFQSHGFGRSQVSRNRPTDTWRSGRWIHGHRNANIAVVYDHFAQRAQLRIILRIFGGLAGVERLGVGGIDTVIIIGIAVSEATLGHVRRHTDGERASGKALARTKSTAAQ